DPRHARGLLLRGKVEHARRDDERALEDFYLVLAFEPDHNEAKLLIADIHLQQGNAKLAAPLLRSVIDDVEPTNPQQAGAQWLLGGCYAGDEGWSEGAGAGEGGLAGGPGSEDDWNEIAEACWRAGDARGAGMAVAQVLHVAPADPRALALRQAIE